MERVVLLLGGNLGDKEQNMSRARELIGERLGDIVSMSSLYYSEAWGFDSSDVFVNMAVVLDTELLPEELLFAIWDIEREFGRDRGTAEEELSRFNARKTGSIGYASRQMDMDIVFYGKRRINTPLLTIPHPLFHLRDFAIIPLKEVASDFLEWFYDDSI